MKFIYKDDNPKEIDWIKMIPQEYFYPDPDKISREIVDSVRNGEKTIVEWGIPREQCLITLGGFEWAAEKRGFDSFEYSYLSSSPEHASVVCTVFWKSFYKPIESDGIEIPDGAKKELLEGGFSYSETGSSNDKNTGEWWIEKGLYVEAATNKAKIRCIRKSLKIPVYGLDEMSPKTKKEQAKEKSKSDAHKQVQSLLDANGWDFSMIQNWANRENVVDKQGEQVAWEALDDLTVSNCYAVLKAINKAVQEKIKKKSE